MVMAWLGVVGAYLAIRAQWSWARGAVAGVILLFVVGMVEAWQAEIVVGSEGIAIRRTFSRLRLPWSMIRDFPAVPRGRRAVIEVVLATGEHRPIVDWALGPDRALSLAAELKAELARHQLLPP
jgi:hypothetical protein